MKIRSLFLLSILAATPALAQDDCIENIVGRTVCGADAEAVRARIRAEQAVKDGKTEEYRAGASNSSFKSGSASGSVYSRYGSAAFVRGGYTFAADANKGLDAFGDGASVQIGLRTPLAVGPNGAWSLEGELGYLRDSRSALVSIDAYGAMIGIRRDLAINDSFGVYGSAAAGLAYLRGYVLGAYSGDDVTFGYSGRAGVSLALSGASSLEVGYRYSGALGADFGVANVRLGSHTAEAGFNIGF